MILSADNCQSAAECDAAGSPASPPPAGLSPADLLRQAPEMNPLKRLGNHLLDSTGNSAAATARLQIMLAEMDLRDPTLALINAAGFAHQQPCQTIDEAFARFGADHVRSHAVVIATAHLVQENSSPTRRRIWRHLLWTGLGSRLITRQRGLPHPDVAFVAGLLHDVGYLLEESCLPQAFTDASGMTIDGTPMHRAEFARLGFDHAELGGLIARTCGFPPVVESALSFHHDPGRSPLEDRLIVQCVQVADAVCTLKGAWSIARAAIALPLQAMQDIGLGRGDVRRLVGDLRHQAAAVETILSGSTCLR